MLFSQQHLLKKLFPLLSFLGPLVKYQLVWHGLISELSVLFHQFMCLFFMLILYCFNYCRFVIQSEVRNYNASNSVLFRITLASLSFQVPLQLHKILDFFFLTNSGNIPVRVLSGVLLTLQGSLACCSPWGHKELDMTERLNNKQIALATTDILMILILLICEHGYVSIYLCHPQFLLSVSYKVQCRDLSSPCLNLVISILLFLTLL